MDNKHQNSPEITNFTADQMLSNQELHGNREFSFSIDQHQFSGYFHGNEIAWREPTPGEILDPQREAIIEKKIHELLTARRDSSPMHHIAMEEAFEGRTYERRQVILNVQGSEFKGFVQNGDIYWFQPHPDQMLDENQLNEIESTIHNKDHPL